MSNLERAIEIAVAAHKGQTRKDGSPYILHPLRLMVSFQSIPEMIAAVLHDVVEDTEVTFEQLQAEGFSQDVIAALRLLTHDSSQEYDEYISAIANNPVARAVKLADLKDNINVFEIPVLMPRDLERVLKYHAAFKRLSND